MNVSDLFRSLSLGELSSLAMSNEGSGQILGPSQPRILRYAEQALDKLYGRFVLKEKDLLLEMHEHITFYHLAPRFAVHHVPESPEEDEPFRYILDLPMEKFEGDVLRVMQVFDGEGCRLPLNDDNDPRSLFSPQAGILQVPRPEPGKTLGVAYQARHARLSGSLTQKVYIPDVLSEALTAYIAYKVFSHIGTQESTVKAQEHLSLFESTCSEVQGNDLVSNTISVKNTSFERGGWI